MSFAQEFARGMRKSPPVVLSSAPFGLLFGALAVDNGFTVGEAVLMSAAVYAGASQMVSIELFGQNVPAWSIVLSVFAVNFRHVLYSAALTQIIRRESPLAKTVIFWLLIDPQFAPKVISKPDAERMVTLISATAKREDVDLFRRFDVMRHWHDVGHIGFETFVSPDGLHMNDWSYACMAKGLGNAIAEAAQRPVLSATARPAR